MSYDGTTLVTELSLLTVITGDGGVVCALGIFGSSDLFEVDGTL